MMVLARVCAALVAGALLCALGASHNSGKQDGVA
jgi:hypothetical protein